MERLFNLDPQLLHDAILLALAVFVLFTFLSYVLFNPARDMLQKRAERVKNDVESAAKERADALKLKEEYEAHLKNIQNEANVILADARKKALANQDKIIEEANKEAAQIKQRATREIELEREKAKDDMKREMIIIASAMANKLVTVSVDQKTQDALLDETLREMGDATWENR